MLSSISVEDKFVGHMIVINKFDGHKIKGLANKALVKKSMKGKFILES